MYLVPIIVPIYVEGSRRYVTTEWKRSLVLLRDSLESRYGEIVVIAPAEVLDLARSEQAFEEVDADRDGIRLHPSIPAEGRARDYWLNQRSRWLEDNSALMAEADVVHSSLDDLFRPRMYDAWKLAVRRDIPTVFVQDTDAVLQIRELNAGRPRLQRMKWRLYCAVYERLCRRAVRRSTLSLLKGESLMARYARYGERVRDFQDTSYTSGEVVPGDTIRRRIAGLNSPRPLRFVYCGRLVPRKGVAEGIRIVSEARRRGAKIELDIIGDGPQRDEIDRLVRSLDLAGSVKLLGRAAYGADLIRRLATYDALYFTPPAEDTPRMIFDGYAAGLPLVGTDIQFVLERARGERAAIVLPRADGASSADALVKLDGNRGELGRLAIQAHEAGGFHAADRWYGRRAEWTFEAVDAFRSRARKKSSNG